VGLQPCTHGNPSPAARLSALTVACYTTATRSDGKTPCGAKPCHCNPPQTAGAVWLPHSPERAHPEERAHGGRRTRVAQVLGDGHVAPKSERMKGSEDNIFQFVFTWIDGAGDKGWTTHYRVKHMPLSLEFGAVLNFLGGFSSFPSCPEFGFESCWWRFTPYEADPSIPWSRNTEHAHNCFDAHATHFSPGVEKVLTAHSAQQGNPEYHLNRRVDTTARVQADQAFDYLWMAPEGPPRY
jgi:hypothetical protein